MAVFVFNTVSAIILARILIPEDFGLVAMTASIIGIAHIFQGFGLSVATIQQKELLHEQVNTLFWINFLIGLLFSIAIVLVAPLLAKFYDDSRIQGITQLLSLKMLIGGASAQHRALLKRQMKFKALATITVVSTLIGISVAIACALYGAGYWSLVALQLSNSLAMLIGLWIACKWRPQKPRISRNVSRMILLGSHVTITNIITSLSRKMDNVLIGRYAGANSLGLYSKAYQLLMFPIRQIRAPIVSVALPVLSNLQYDPDRYSRYYRNINFLIAFTAMPIVVFLFVTCDMLIPLLFGANWIGMVPIFRVLAAAAFIQPVYGVIGSVFVSTGRTRQQLLKTTLHSSFVLTAFIIGLQWGVLGLTIAYSLATYLGLIPVLIYCFHDTPLKLRDFFIPISAPASLSILAGAIAWGSKIVLMDISHWLLIILSAIIYFSIYISIWFTTLSGRNKLKSIKAYIMILLSRT